MAFPDTFALTLYAGDDDPFTVRWKEDDGTPIDLTGSTAKMQLKLEPCGTVVLELIGIIDTPTSGEIIFDFTSANTAALIIDCQTTCYKYDVEITQSGGDIITILRGLVRVVKDITT